MHFGFSGGRRSTNIFWSGRTIVRPTAHWSNYNARGHLSAPAVPLIITIGSRAALDSGSIWIFPPLNSVTDRRITMWTVKLHQGEVHNKRGMRCWKMTCHLTHVFIFNSCTSKKDIHLLKIVVLIRTRKQLWSGRVGQMPLKTRVILYERKPFCNISCANDRKGDVC